MDLPEKLYMIYAMSSVLDTGKYNDISVSEIQAHIKKGDLIQFLKNKFGEDTNLTLFEMKKKLEKDYVRKLQTLLEIHQGREYDKWGVANNGLCLLISWTAEIIQHEYLFNEEL